jgi:hypothetical protein
MKKTKLPRTNWNGLDEHQKEVFFNYYMHITQNNENPSHECVIENTMISDCNTCKTLFPDLPKEKTSIFVELDMDDYKCPCHWNERSFEALAKCLRKDGYID